MSYLDRLDAHYRECCGVLSVEEQVRSGFRTKGEVNKTAKILFREFGKKTKAKRTRNKKTGEEECCCCSVEAIAKNLVPPTRSVAEGQKQLSGRAFKLRSRGGLPVPVGITTADAGTQYADNGAILVPAAPLSVSSNSVLFSDAPSVSGFSGMTLSDQFSGLAAGPNYSISTYSEFPDDLTEIESVSDDMSVMSLTEERAEIARANALGEDELMELYNYGIIDLNQLAEGVEQIREGRPPREILQLGSRADNPAGYTLGRGGARQGAGRPTREQVRIGIEEDMRPSEVRMVDRMVDSMIDDLEAEEDFFEEAD
tara:strand:- start:402 stop:1340 length:939 start_codon:yes stop_codon:yes gene_type:complete